MSAAKNSPDKPSPDLPAELPKRTCFVVAPIGGDGTDTRRRSDQVLRHIIDPVLSELNFEDAVRADRITDGGLITRQVIDHLFTADLVIADLTDHNPNVFYELALRHAFQKPFVQLVVGKSHAPLPFDVAEQRTIFFDHTDLDDVERAKATLAEYVKATMEPGADVESPVSRSMELLTLKGSSNPEDRGQADIIEMLEDLRSQMVRVNHGYTRAAADADVYAMRRTIEKLARTGALAENVHLGHLIDSSTSSDHDEWARRLMRLASHSRHASPGGEVRGEGVPSDAHAAAMARRDARRRIALDEASASIKSL